MLLELKNISKTYYNTTGRAQRQILKDLNLKIEQGETIALVGPSGSGKTTILNLIGLLDTADSGSIIFDGKDLPKLSKKEQLSFRNRDIGFVFQQHFLLPQCSVWENVLVPVLPNKANLKTAYNRAEALLKQLGLWDLRHQRPAELSVGECQRAALVRALINSPRLLLADEPTGSLDQENAHQLVELLLDINRSQGVGLVVVTHSMSVAQRMNKVYEMSNGALKLSEQCISHG